VEVVDKTQKAVVVVLVVCSRVQQLLQQTPTQSPLVLVVV
jgi:hypothetical protein